VHCCYYVLDTVLCHPSKDITIIKVKDHTIPLSTKCKCNHLHCLCIASYEDVMMTSTFRRVLGCILHVRFRGLSQVINRVEAAIKVPLLLVLWIGVLQTILRHILL
jgi:hypothetical protein